MKFFYASLFTPAVFFLINLVVFLIKKVYFSWVLIIFAWVILFINGLFFFFLNKKEPRLAYFFQIVALLAEILILIYLVVI